MGTTRVATVNSAAALAGAEDVDDAPLDSQLLASIPWTWMSRATRRTFGWSWTWPGSSQSTAATTAVALGFGARGENEREGEGANEDGEQRSGGAALLIHPAGDKGEGGPVWCEARARNTATWRALVAGLGEFGGQQGRRGEVAGEKGRGRRGVVLLAGQ